ncbi:CBS domain-containing protein [Patescibacteria group bacterium]|nr:CBS domain-containing protein [Patescibacteria group bacterium]MBU1868728.1 CBS domain-containing protein [Patescibacteria group bacterium]
MSNNNNQFLTLFSQFENFLAENFPGNSSAERISYALENDNFRKKLESAEYSKDNLHNLRQLRNILTHNPNYLTISPEPLEDVNRLVLIYCKQAKDLATPQENIYTVSPKTPVQEVIQIMDKRDFSFVPIISHHKFIGLFSRKVVLKLAAQSKINENLDIQDIQEFITNNRDQDSYEFLSANAPADTARQLFSQYMDQGKHLGVILLTKDGGPSGKIEGLITAWDLYKIKN